MAAFTSVPSDLKRKAHRSLPGLRPRWFDNFDRTVTANYTDATGSTTQLPLTVAGGTAFAINTGGGIRFYMGQRYGLRVEAKAYKPYGDYPDVFGKVEVGFFFQLR